MGLRRLARSVEERRYEVQGEREDRRIVGERHEGVKKDGATDAAARDDHVRNLKAHPDGKREVREVDIAWRLGAFEPETFRGSATAIVEMRVPERERSVRDNPRQHHRRKREAGPHMGLLGR